MWHPKPQFPLTLKDSTAEEKLEYFEKGFVLHHHNIEKVTVLVEKQFMRSSRSMCMVVGPTGVGKSCFAKNLVESYYKSIANRHKCENSLPMVYVEAIVLSKPQFDWSDFFSRLLVAMGEQQEIAIYGEPIEHAGGGRSYGKKNRSEADYRGDVEKRVNELSVRFIVIDEIQHIIKYGGKDAEKTLDILKSLASSSRCKIIGVGTYEAIISMGHSGQLVRRILKAEFSHYEIGSPDDKCRFDSAYMGMLAHIPIQIQNELADYSKEVYLGCCGCVGVLKDWLYDALSNALSDGDDVELGISHLKETRLSARELVQLAEDIYEGKIYFSQIDDSEVLLALESSVALEIQESSEQTNTKTKISQRKPGQRKPGRDKVG